MIATNALRLGLFAGLLAAAACSTDTRTVIVAVSPANVTIQTNGVEQFTASVVGTPINDVVWSLAEGASAGTLSATGLYTAPATAPAGGSTFHVVATSQADTTKSATATVTVLAPSPVTSINVTPSAASLKTNSTYQFTALINGNPSTAVTWAVAAGGVGGTISATGLYTAPSTTGRDAVTATATADTTRSATAAVTVTLSPAPVLTYASNKLTCTVGTPCSLGAPNNSGGPYLSLAVSPALPAGLTLDPLTGAISGTPTVVAAAAGYAVIATNAGGSGTTVLTITVKAIAPSALSYGSNFIICTVNAVCPAVTPTNAGGAATSFTISPALPAGLGINPSTGAISGTPTMISPSSAYAVTATNSGGTTSAVVNVSVIDNPPATVKYSSASLTCTIGVACGLAAPTTTGGAVTSYSVSPTLPDGLTLDPATGAISGTPNAITAGALYVVLASNSGGSVIVDLEIAVNDLPPTGLTYTNNTISCTKGTPCALPAPTHGGGAVISYSVSPALPAGLTIDVNSGALTGTPTVVSAKAPYVVTATNSGGQSTATINVTVNDSAPTALVYNPSTGSCTETVFCSFGPPTSSGGKVTAYSVTPALPAGLNLSPTTGLITGTALAVSPSTNYVVKAANSGGSTTTTINLTVLEAAPRSLTYSPSALVCSQNVPCSLGAPHHDGGQVDSYSISPNLPAGLSINAATGAITGTPTAQSDQTTYTVTATNSIGSTSAQVTVTVNAPPPPPPADLAYSPSVLTCSINVACSLPAPSSDGGAVTGYTIAPALPAGLAIDPSTGAISGTPTAASPATNYTVTAANAGGSSTATVNITVDPAVAWTALGPLGGFATQIAVSADSNTLFAVMKDNNVYRSTDAGAHWTFASSGLEYQGVTAVAIDPTTDGALYASTQNGGFATSTNNGATWTMVGPSGVSGFSVAADPFTAGTFYGGASNGETSIYASVDRGTTITPSDSGIGGAQYAIVVADPSTQGQLYAMTSNRVVVSTDGAANWTETGSGIPNEGVSLESISIDPVAPNYLYVAAVSGSGSVVYYSSDSGVTWTAGTAGLENAGNAELVMVDPSLHSRIYLTTSTGTYVSADSGVDWASFPVTPSTAVVVAVAPNGTLYATDANGIYSTSNGGANWAADNAGLTATEMDSVAVAPSGTLFATGTTGTYKSANGGSTWTVIDGVSGAQIAIDPATPSDLIVLVQESGTVRLSQDGGATWTDGNITGLTSLTFAPGGTTVFAGSTNGVQVSHDDGHTWSDSSNGINVIQPSRHAAVIAQQHPFISTVAFLSTDPTRLIALNFNAVFFSSDSGANWAQSAITPVTGDAFRFAASAGQSGLIYVAGDAEMYVSGDGGQTFSGLEPLNQNGFGPSGALAVNPSSGEIYVETNGALYSLSPDASQSTSLGSGLTSQDVRQIVSTGPLLYVATFGGGVLVSGTDGLDPIMLARAK
jgi:hypothetical protein